MTMQTAALDAPVAGDEKLSLIPDQRLVQWIALRAGGQTGLSTPSPGPGPLVDPDGLRSLEVEPTLKPLKPAPVHCFLGRAAGTLQAEAVAQKMTDAAPFHASQDRALRPQTPCQLGVDAKAFTGRGAPRAVRLASKAVDDIHARMRAVAHASVRLSKGLLYLAVHARSATNQHSLRWRGYTVVNGKTEHKHLTWEEAAHRIQRHPYEVMVQLQMSDVEARELNQLEQAARAELRRLHASELVLQGVESLR